MTIRRFLITVFGILLLLGVYLNIQYLRGKSCQENSSPIENYHFVGKTCSFSYRMGSTVDILYKGKKYYVPVATDICKTARQSIIGKLYYMPSEDEIFYEDYYMPFPYVYLTYIASVLLPLLGSLFIKASNAPNGAKSILIIE